MNLFPGLLLFHPLLHLRSPLLKFSNQMLAYLKINPTLSAALFLSLSLSVCLSVSLSLFHTHTEHALEIVTSW